MVTIRRTNTKERIIKESLRLFSTHGYNAVGVEMIAAAVKVTPPSLYKHFKGKKEILDEITGRAIKLYKERLFDINVYSDEEVERFTLESFSDIVLKHINNVLHDEELRCVRKLCVIEQFRNEDLRALHLNRTYLGNEQAANDLLRKILKVKNIQVDLEFNHLVKLFTLPIIATVDHCYCDPDYEKDGLEYIQAHIKYIWMQYIEK